MEQQQKKTRRASSVYMRGRTSIGRAQSSLVVRGSVPARWDTLDWLWSAPCQSEKPVYRWPSTSPEPSVASKAAAWRRCYPASDRRFWPDYSGRAVLSNVAGAPLSTCLWRRWRVWKLQAFATFLAWQPNRSSKCGGDRGAWCLMWW